MFRVLGEGLQPVEDGLGSAGLGFRVEFRLRV